MRRPVELLYQEPCGNRIQALIRECEIKEFPRKKKLALITNGKPIRIKKKNMSDVITVAIEAAQQAGTFLVDNFGKISQIDSKGDRSLATNLDREAEKIIVDMIKTKFPGHGIMAEEGGAEGNHDEYLWIIDPLDGTHNYIRNINIFGVCVGVVYKGEFVAGVIAMPVDKELYVAEKGNGAYKNDEKIAISAQTDLSQCSLSFDSSISKSADVMSAVLHDVALNVFNVRMFGSSARILSYVAEGKLDGSIEFHDLPWDFAAGVCLIEEAGGVITQLNGQPLTATSTGYTAANKTIHEQMQKIIGPQLIL
ncbi:inositol monophosphatase family protein, partial [Candidatus Omnitrophota bacterium]